MDYKEKLKAIINSNKTPLVDINTLLKYFPELKESEDEKIRKELLQIAKESEDSFYMVMTPDKRKHLITWLEKQAQKPADNIESSVQNKPWSEEDEAKLKSILFHIEDVENKDVIDWLKSIKDRVQPKQEWSEEDETELTNIIIMLKEGASLHFNKKDITKAVSWLKFLRPQPQWKPSDEQMKALDIAIRCGIQLGTWEEEALESLFNVLKELREE